MSLKHHISMFLYPIYKVLVKKPKIKSINDTMDELIKGKSIARFGDGELQAISNNIDNSFQSNSLELSNEMDKAIRTKNSNTLIAIAIPFSWDLSLLNVQAKNYWEPLLIRNWHKWKKVLRKSVYFNAFVTRPYFDFNQEYRKSVSPVIFKKFKKVWDNKEILIVEGEYSRFGVNDDLLDSSQSVKRIIGPSRDAFKKIKDIEYEIRKYVSHNKIDIILLSLGQTATILTIRLTDLNVQIIDIGHLDIEYNWFLQNAQTKVNIIGKWTNEADKKFIEFKDKSILKEYNSQIVSKIK